MGITRFPHGILATPNLGGSGSYGPDPELFGGKTYFVDYDNGSDSNDGSISYPVKQINKAIELSNAERILETVVNSAGYIRRNRIYVKAFATAATAMGSYDAISTVPQHVDIIGVGATVLSNGGGVVGVGSSYASTTAAAALTVGSSGMRGVNFYNLQFIGGGTSTDCITATGTIMRCGFYNCSFYALSGTDAHIGTSGHWAGNTMYRCHFAHNLSPSTCGYNFYMTTGVFTDNRFEECMFNWANTANVCIGATSLSHGTLFYHCVFGQGGTPTDSYADTSVDGGAFLAQCFFDNDATDPLQRSVTGNDAGCIKGKTLIEDAE